MPVVDRLALRYPAIAAALPRAGLCNTPTPLCRHSLAIGGHLSRLLVKHDEKSGELYGGNKLRKLDHLLGGALNRGAEFVATFGAIGSHHAIATALYGRHLGMTPICFLGHQASVERVYATLAAHVANATRIVRFGGTPQERFRLVRAQLRGRRFIDAALEFGAQLQRLGTQRPVRLYVASGTMGTTAGLALGFALAGANVEVQAVRVTSARYVNPAAIRRLMQRTVRMLRRIDPGFPARLEDRTRIRLRDEFAGDGYTRPTPAGREAMLVARQQLGLELENTYTAKAFAALLHDVAKPDDAWPAFWNSYNARPLPTYRNARLKDTTLPADFARYFPSA